MDFVKNVSGRIGNRLGSHKPLAVALLLVALTVLSVGLVSTALLSGHSARGATFGPGMHHRGGGPMAGMQFAGDCPMQGMPQKGRDAMPPRLGRQGFAQGQEFVAGQEYGQMPPQASDNQTMTQMPFGRAAQQG